MKSGRITLARARQAWRVIGDARDLRRDRPAQARAVVDGLCRLFGADNGFHVDMEDFRPGGRSRPRRIDYGTLVDPILVDWFEGDLARECLPGDDVMAAHAIGRPDRAFVLTQRAILPTLPSGKYPFFFDVIQRYRLQDNLVIVFRPGASSDSWGYAMHRRDGRRGFGAVHRKLALMVVSEFRRLHDAGHLGPSPASLSDLPPRQRQVLTALLRGQPPKVIAMDLNLSVHTVRDHVKQLLPRFGVNGVPELLAKFVDRP